MAEKFKGKSGKPRASKFAQSAAKSEAKDAHGEEFDYGTFRVTFRNGVLRGIVCFRQLPVNAVIFAVPP